MMWNDHDLLHWTSVSVKCTGSSEFNTVKLHWLIIVTGATFALYFTVLHVTDKHLNYFIKVKQEVNASYLSVTSHWLRGKLPGEDVFKLALTDFSSFWSNELVNKQVPFQHIQ